MKRLRIPFLLALAACAALLLASCGGGGSAKDELTPSPVARNTPPPLIGGPTQSELPMKVVVTLSLFEDFVREIGGDNVEVSSLLPAGADPHTYEPSADDLATVADADFVFLNGGGLDDHLRPLIEANAGEDTKIVPFAPNIASPGGGMVGGRAKTAVEAGDNPHLYLDPRTARVYPELVFDEFNIYDGINEQFYRGNYQAYAQRVSDLDAEILADVQTIPAANRMLLTYHDSFIHFANRYGLQVSAFAFAADGRDQARDAAGLEQVVGDNALPAVFAEYGFETGLMQEVATAAGVDLCTLQSDVLDPAVSTYFDMMRQNVDEIVRCLGGG